MDPGYNPTTHPCCLGRNFIVLPVNDPLIGQEKVDDVLKEKAYYAMVLAMTKTPTLQNPPRCGVHTIGHIGPGGEVCIYFFLFIYTLTPTNDYSVHLLTIHYRKQISGRPPTIPSFTCITLIWIVFGICGRSLLQKICMPSMARCPWERVYKRSWEYYAS